MDSGGRYLRIMGAKNGRPLGAFCPTVQLVGSSIIVRSGWRQLAGRLPCGGFTKTDPWPRSVSQLLPCSIATSSNHYRSFSTYFHHPPSRNRLIGPSLLRNLDFSPPPPPLSVDLQSRICVNATTKVFEFMAFIYVSRKPQIKLGQMLLSMAP